MYIPNKILETATHTNTVEPPNKGHVGTRSFVINREVSYIILEVKMYWCNRNWDK